MSAVLKASFSVTGDEAPRMPPRAAKPAAFAYAGIPLGKIARTVPTIRVRNPRKRTAHWWIFCGLGLFLVGLGSALCYGIDLPDVLKKPLLQFDVATSDPETVTAYVETITPPPANVVAPAPVVPALPVMPDPVPVQAVSAQPVPAPNDIPAAAINDSTAGIKLTASSQQVPYPAMPEESVPETANPAITVVDSRIESKIKEMPVTANISVNNINVPVENNIPPDLTQAALQESVHAVAPPATGSLLNEAQAKLDSGDDRGALSIYTGILARDHKNKAALAGKAFAQQHIGQYKAAAETDRLLLKLYPKDDAARADLLTALGAWGAPEALSELQGIVKADPGFAPAQAALAQALVRHDSALQALPHAWRAAQIEPQNIIYQLDLAITYDQLGHSGEAIAIYRQVMKTYNAMETHASALPIDPTAVEQRVSYLEGLMTAVEPKVVAKE